MSRPPKRKWELVTAAIEAQQRLLEELEPVKNPTIDIALALREARDAVETLRTHVNEAEECEED